MQKEVALALAMRIVDDAWAELQRDTYVQLRMGLVPARLPDLSITEATRRSEIGRSLLARVESLDTDTLSHDLALTLRLVRFRAHTWARQAEWYWTVIDPLGIGFFGLFLPTAYCGANLINSVHQQLASFPFLNDGDCDRYLALISDYVGLIEQCTSRTAGQADRGIRMPKIQVPQARALLSAFRSRTRTDLGVSPARLGALASLRFVQELERRIAHDVEPAWQRAIEGLSDKYLAQAPDEVGMGQYPVGTKIYAELVRLHTTLDLTPEEVHKRGLDRMDGIERSMEAIRAELGFQGDGRAFVAHLNNDSRWRAGTADGVAQVFQRYIDRLKPRIDSCFSLSPVAPYGVAPLPEALQGSMTFGYYDAPKKNRSEGLYLFNSKNLTNQALFNIAALTYHELVPGHHLHMALQQENTKLGGLRAYSFVNAYNEGWAEYAATLAGEMGLYEKPEERYGRLVMDAFLTCRLVVDTGMNTLGWSLERGRDYMRAHSGMSEADILTESLRYSCDIPGQALAYKLGEVQILAMRDRMRLALGARFDLKHFHAVVLGPGALPISDLDWHVDHETHLSVEDI